MVSPCCARAACGHAAAAAVMTLMKSRRRIAFPRARDDANDWSAAMRLQQGLAEGGMGFGGYAAGQQVAATNVAEAQPRYATMDNKGAGKERRTGQSGFACPNLGG